jgi:hypothetical protein
MKRPVKGMKFQPGSFLEIDDLRGGRQVVLVGRDGLTCWDSINTTEATPLLIHPVMQPVDLGTLASFVSSRGLSVAVPIVLQSLRVQHPGRESDSLFVMRMLWSLPSAPLADWMPDATAIDQAYRAAEQQEMLAYRLQSYTRRYCEQLDARM